MGRPGLARHRKFLRLARHLDDAAPGFGSIVARGALETLWDACYESGDSYLGDSDDVEALCGWRGRSGVLCKALVDAGGEGHSGFIEEVSPGRYQIHDLFDHAPEYVKKRHEREHARRKKGQTLRDVRAEAARSRWDANGCKRPPLASGRDANGHTPAPAPAPAPTHKETSCSEPSPAAEPEVTLTCVGEGPKEYGVTREQIATWAASHPGVDVRQEMLRARDWLVANPTKRKTHRGMERFLVAWLGRSQDRGGGMAKVRDIRTGVAPAAAHAEFGEGEGSRDVQF